ncbi:hypothetical protein D9756_003647 [Leucocoprinus leucothites]|uniref:F-box domain-containing protein n=1 Tax=Leucocoprinus leucothites TaxID=201217 RepID=A0A8H5G777_9AGAR|nr:hypothetical protein D9756_003647 [Leucoagaricus leucothites]
MTHTHTALPYRLTPISNLPSEILISIFCKGTEEEFQPTHSQAPNPFHRPIPFILQVSQVCHFWRNLSRSVPVLWSTFANYDTLNAHCVEESLRLSGNSLLDVKLSSGLRFRNPRPSNTHPLYTHSQRIRSLYCTTHSSTVTSDLQTLLEQSMPALRTLILSYGLGTWNVGSQSAATFLSLLPRGAPSLTTFVLYRCYVDLSSTAMSRLRVPELHDIPDFYCPTVPEWLNHLSNMPDLESLSLTHSIATTISNIPAITLSHLHTLRFTGDFSGFALLEKLMVPQLKELDLSFECFPDARGTVTDDVISDAFVRCVDADRLSGRAIAFRLKNDRLVLQTLDSCDGVDLRDPFRLFVELSWHHRQSRHGIASLAFDAACERLKRVTSFVARIDAETSPASLPSDSSALHPGLVSSLEKFTRDLTQVRQLAVYSTRDICAMVSYPFGHLPPSGSVYGNPLAFPSLEAVVIVTDPGVDEEWWIREFVVHRTAIGHPIRKISFPRRTDNKSRTFHELPLELVDEGEYQPSLVQPPCLIV